MSEKVYENNKMVVEVDGVDTVFITNKASESMTSIQVNDEEGFQVVYSESSQSMSSVLFGLNGEIEILQETSVAIDTDVPTDEEEILAEE